MKERETDRAFRLLYEGGASLVQVILRDCNGRKSWAVRATIEGAKETYKVTFETLFEVQTWLEDQRKTHHLEG